MSMNRHCENRRFINLLFSLALLVPTLAYAAPCGEFVPVASPGAAVADGSLSHLSGLDDGTAWALGSHQGAPSLLYFNGSDWTAVPIPEEAQGITFSSSTSTPGGEVWFAGTRVFSVYEVEVIFLRARQGSVDRVDHVFSRRAPIAMSASASNDVWALTGQGNVIHFDGADWSEMDVPPAYMRLYPRGIHAVAPDDVWAVGYGGQGRGEYIGYVQHWDGSSWTTVSTPVDGLRNHFFRDIHGSAADDVWLVGYINYTQSLVLHWDGDNWSTVPGPASDAPLLGVTVPDRGEVWAIPYSQNDLNVIYRRYDNAWTAINPLTPTEGGDVRWNNVMSAGTCDVWASGIYNPGTGPRTLIGRIIPILFPGC